MHLSVIDDDAHVASVGTRERTLLHALHHTLQDGGHETSVDGTTNHRVDEYEFAAPLQIDFFLAFDVHLELLTVDFERCRVGHSLGVRLQNQVDFAELTGTARLLLVAIVGTSHLRDGFAIRNLRLDVFDLNLLVVFQTPLQRAQVELALTVNDGLAKFFRLLDHPRRVFLTHLHHGSHQFFHFRRVHGLDCTRIFRVRILDEVKFPVDFLRVQRVASLHILQFHGATDVASLQLIDSHAVRTGASVKLTHALLRAAIGVGQVVASLHRTAHHLEIRHFADVRLHAGLEEEQRCRTVAVGSDFVACGILHLRHIAHEGNHVAEEFHQAAHAHVLACANAENGENRARDESLADAFAHLVFREVFRLEELLHQSVVASGCGFHEGCLHFLGLVELVGGNVLDDGRTAFWLPRIFLHQQYVDDGVEAGTGRDRILHGHAVRTINILQLVQNLVEVAVVLVELVHEENHGFSVLGRVAESVHRANLRAIRSIDEDDGLIGHVQCRDGTADKVVRARTVDDVQLLAVPLGVENGRKDRITVLLLHGEVIAHRVFTLYGATAFDDAGLIDHCFGKSRLAGTRTANQRDVFDFICLIDFHCF